MISKVLKSGQNALRMRASAVIHDFGTFLATQGCYTMRSHLTTILTTVLLTGLLSFAPTTANVNDVVSALKVGDANRISKYFDNLVEISLNDRSHSYSRSQAELVVRDFFTNNDVTNFEVMYKGNVTDGEYCMGKLTTRHGQYRTSFSLKNRGDQKLIQEISFEGVDE
jgi:Domain of unknown function (DUF4783)